MEFTTATVASVLVGASRLSQLQDSVHALDNLTFTAEELAAIQKNISIIKTTTSYVS